MAGDGERRLMARHLRVENNSSMAKSSRKNAGMWRPEMARAREVWRGAVLSYKEIA